MMKGQTQIKRVYFKVTFVKLLRIFRLVNHH